MYHGVYFNRNLIHILGQNLSRTCDMKGKDITKVYLEALTHAKFDNLRIKMAKLANKHWNTKLRLEG